MKKAMYLRDELLEQAGLTDRVLTEWERQRLVRPDGLTKEKTRFYAKDTLDRIQYIKTLMDLGYQPEHILKIIKKVGLPRTGRAKDRPEKLHAYLTVGDLAERVGISPRAVKHWEGKGIIEPDMRSEGGFRLYSETYVYLCQMIKDLQLFGYSLDEIKSISDLFRDFLAISQNLSAYSSAEAMRKLESMTGHMKHFQDKMELFKTGMERWEDLLKKKKREISGLKAQIRKRQEPKGQKQGGTKDA
jgi:DNA-binding transcriptional MerR regulator